MDFNTKLETISRKNDSLVCVGLDVDKEKMPQFLFDTSDDPFFEFTKEIIDQTKDIVCAYKLNMAFYEALGSIGYRILRNTVRYIPKEIVVILDGKRNDIGNTAKKYAESLFEDIHADAITVNPYLGFDGVKPFLDYPDTCSFILCRTSNRSAGDFQDLKSDGKPLYIHVAQKVKTWNETGTCGVVVGATYPEELKEIRTILGDSVPFLIPGIGTQGGDVKKTVEYGTNTHKELAVINSSRGIIFAGSEDDYAEKARDATILLNKEINIYRV